MSIHVACECGHSFEAPEEDAGHLARCPVCARESVVPKPSPPDEVMFIPGEARPTVTSGKAVASLALGNRSRPSATVSGMVVFLP